MLLKFTVYCVIIIKKGGHDLMDSQNKEPLKEKGALNDKDFYEQACSYFYYHAGQRTTMINYFIAVFGAFIALYGALISTYTLASMLIAVFMGIVSFIFFMLNSTGNVPSKTTTGQESFFTHSSKDFSSLLATTFRNSSCCSYISPP